jgi:hypothetical protein
MEKEDIVALVRQVVKEEIAKLEEARHTLLENTKEALKATFELQ